MYCPYKNVIQAADLFNLMVQKPGESIDDFVTDLRQQAQKCDFGDKCERLTGDHIVVGIQDTALRERLLRKRDVTLDKIISACKAAEISKRHVQEIATCDQKPEVNAIHEQKKYTKPKRRPMSGNKPPQLHHSSENPNPTSSPRSLPQKQYQQVLDEFPDIFDGIGQLPGLYSIHLRDGAVPTVCAPRRIPCALEEKVKRELERMEENGVIVPVTDIPARGWANT
ncbi:hypothetical protein HPB52_016128 [Rhipicephalus sanguineus]|uniref:Retrotransposon gag domain-containing protein n=1 Tax=Rhipicephalus sanguineus TaxID=34632 RepID=A0A9D4PHF7_RHISA|nr:hypothetical protein HPB52_016128 [Rhipicephalus sanguineus]